METNFTLKETSVLYGLLTDSTSDIILKTGRNGCILHASSGLRRLATSLSHSSTGTPLWDVVHSSCRTAVREAHDAAIVGRVDHRWFEVSADAVDGEKHWFDMQIRALHDDGGEIYGALGIMRSTDERRMLERKLCAAELTDPLTGLINRRALVSTLQRMMDQGIGGSLALFDIDYFQALNMQYGQSVGDKVLVVFSELLRTMMRENDIVARIDGECLGVLLPGIEQGEARQLCDRIVSTLSELRREAGKGGFAITASAGLSHIGHSVDDTFRRAELALFLAKAKGRNRLEMEYESRAA